VELWNKVQEWNFKPICNQRADVTQEADRRRRSEAMIRLLKRAQLGPWSNLKKERCFRCVRVEFNAVDDEGGIFLGLGQKAMHTRIAEKKK